MGRGGSRNDLDPRRRGSDAHDDVLLGGGVTRVGGDGEGRSGRESNAQDEPASP
jgi:hypothetical protein